MVEQRIRNHPVLDMPEINDFVTFYWNKQPLSARRGEMIASALMANGIRVFGHHHADNTAQGIFCANGQCAKCTVIANGIPVKSCMTPVKENMIVESAEGLPDLPNDPNPVEMSDIEELPADILIIGGGPAGLSAAIEMGKRNIKALLIDDKEVLGGKLVLQTHKFFGSQADSRAGTRGNDIGKILAEEVSQYESIEIWTESTVLFVFSDKKVGILKQDEYKIVTPKLILNAAGAREKFLRFNGNTLAGIYGAGAFQTLVNRDLVKPTERLFIVGGGNVGLIAGYHALQAGINVVGLVEAAPSCGGYKVHADKLVRLGVPIYTSHSILSANGTETVEGITIVQVDDKFQQIPGTEKSFSCDTILMAVGLDSLDEFTQEAVQAGLPVMAAGDAFEIAEASSAMFNGKIVGLKICKEMAADVEDVPQEWYDKANLLKSHPGQIKAYNYSDSEEGVMPIIHCLQEIPCNPCTTVCPVNAIKIDDGGLMGTPYYTEKCIGCGKCVVICPGLAITLVDYRKDQEHPLVTLPYEVGNFMIKEGDIVEVNNIDGVSLGHYPVISVQMFPKQKTQTIKIEVDREIAKQVASFRIQDDTISAPLGQAIIPNMEDDGMVCLCERVRVKDVRALIKQGIYDMNQIKAITRAGMGPCGAKTCDVLLKQVMRQEGVPADHVVPNTKRPVFIEAQLSVFAGGKREE